MRKALYFFVMIAVISTIANPVWAASAVSNVIVVNVFDPPSADGITPDVQELYANETPQALTLAYTPGDAQVVNFVWSQSLDDGGSWTEVQNGEDDTYSPPAVSAQYKCKITDGNGLYDESGVAIVTVYEVLKVIINSAPVADPNATMEDPQDGFLGVVPDVSGGVVMTPTASGGWGETPSYTYTWQYSIDEGVTWLDVADAIAAAAAAEPEQDSGYTIDGSSLIIDPVAEEHQAAYRCVVDGGHPEEQPI